MSKKFRTASKVIIGVVLFVSAVRVLVGLGHVTSRDIRQEDYASWPFTIPKGRLHCDWVRQRPVVTLRYDGIEYALNGAAMAIGFPKAESIYGPGKNGGDVQPFIDDGLQLCPAR